MHSIVIWSEKVLIHITGGPGFELYLSPKGPGKLTLRPQPDEYNSIPPLTKEELTARLGPENEREAAFLEDAEFRRGLRWGKPRYGHPEGAIWRHVNEVNANVDRLPVGPDLREKLRLVSWVHDTFKFKEDKSHPRDWTKHHGVYARQFLARFCQDPGLLNLTELHDEAYYIWRLTHLYNRQADAENRLAALKRKLGDYWQLYYLFFKCDTCTGDKNPAPLDWFETRMTDIEVVELAPLSS